MKSNFLRILLLALVTLPLASYTCEPEPVEVSGPIVEATELAQLLELTEWLERLEDGWVPLSLVEAILVEE
jgi:hypothetical protein